MKYLLILLLTGTGLMAQQNTQLIDKAAVEKVLFAQQAAWNEGNLEKYMEGYWKSDSLKFIGKKGITYGWQATLSNYKKSYPDKATMGTLAFTLLEEQGLGKDYFMVIGKWQLQREKDAPGGYFSLLFRRFNGYWYIIADHTS